MASSAFSFHCMICFEEFDPQTNYPVVLPCGHTYVCIECANRLDKCMECRMPLSMKMEVPPPPPPPPPPPQLSSTNNTPTLGINATAGSSSGGTSPSLMMLMSSSTPTSQIDQQKENQKNQYAERVKNSPGWRRRYGTDSPGNNNNYGKRGGNTSSTNSSQPPQPVPKLRLPLPKNAVLLSLIQASEPARRRAEVEAPSTPQKCHDDNLTSPPRLSSSSASGGGGGGNYNSGIVLGGSGSGSGGGTSALPQFSRPSPLFLDKSHSSDQHDPILGGGGGGHGGSGGGGGVGGFVDTSADDEEHKIRVGTYLEGGPCGTYAVAVKSGLLVYPTLFEHTLPSALSGLRGRGGRSGSGAGAAAGGSLEEEEIDVMKRNVEQVVKNYYREGVMKNEKKCEEEAAAAAAKKKLEKKASKSGSSSSNALGSSDAKNSSSNKNLATWVECHEDEKVETHCRMELLDAMSPHEVVAEGDDGEEDTEEEDTEEDDHFTSMSDPGVVETRMGGSFTDSKRAVASAMKSISRGMAGKTAGSGSPGAAGDSETTAELSFSLTISEDENDTGNNDECSSTECEVGETTATIRRSQSTASGSASQSTTPTRSNDPTLLGEKKFVRHFSVGAHPTQTVSQTEKKTGSNANDDDFERPLIRLKYGDRVQVVSMDSRGWVKLARGYGYIRLENDKQLVKVGGTSDKACQIEAMLHELSLERNRLKHEQMKLERLSAGLMIDLQSSLLTSDDHVVVPAPQGLIRSDSDLSYSVRSKSPPGACHDDIDVSTRRRPGISPSSSLRGEHGHNQPSSHHREIRTAKSHSPGRSSSLGPQNKLPPSPPFGQVLPSLASHQNWSTGVNTPTRVNFRTGLSGHRALTSTHSHPHDFISGGAVRSMSNHAGISSSKKSDRRGRSIY